MSERKVFCERCRNDVIFTVTDKKMDGIIKGDTYTYIGKYATCIECNSRIYVEEINDYNLKVLYNKYREANGIIPLDKVLEMHDN